MDEEDVSREEHDEYEADKGGAVLGLARMECAEQLLGGEGRGQR